jgi:hypothetical protein
MAKKKPREKRIIGWREWVGLPDLGIAAIKVKIDSGARSSSLHAFNLSTFQRGSRTFARFSVHPFQRDSKRTIIAEAEVSEFRKVRSSSGHAALRPVIVTTMEILGEERKIELTLAKRDQMGFRMLLGRQAVRRRYLVDTGRSYYGGKPERGSSETRNSLT